MNCVRFQEIAADLDRPGIVSAELRQEALAHAETCADCALLQLHSEALDSELRRLASRDTAWQAPARIEANLLREFRARQGTVARRGTLRYAAAIGIAAMLVLSAGLWLHWRGAGTARGPMATSTPPATTMAPNPQARSAQPSPAATSESGGNVASKPSIELATVEDPAEFIPLPDAVDPASLDDAAVVRVVMPRAALASFGLPVAAMEGDGTVRADLIVSADGTPQAIRLLSQDDASGSPE
jgi:hypothetical protein